MISRLQRHAQPIVVVSEEDLRSLASLANEAKRDSQYCELKITITLRNGDKIITSDVDQLFLVPNIGSNPITSIELERGSYGTRHIDVLLGGGWESFHGARLIAHGDVNFTREAADRFEKVVRRERPLGSMISSMNPFLLSAIFLLVVLGLMVDVPAFSELAKTQEYAKYLSATLLIIPFYSVTLITVSYLQYKFLGRAIFNWGDGKVRSEKNFKIANYIFWTVPVAFVLKHAQTAIGV